MRALVYPADGYAPTSILIHLERSGREVINWQPAEHSAKDSDAAWDAALQQAEAVFHVLHGHEAHARDTVQRLLRSRTNDNPVTFIGITTPLTWAATPAPPSQQQGLATANININSIGSNDRSSGGGSAEEQHVQDGTADGAPAGAPVLTERDASSRRSAAVALPTYQVEQLILRCNRPGRLHTYVLCPGILYGAGEDDGQLHNLFKTAWEGKEPLMVLGTGTNRLPTAHVADLASYAAAIAQLQPRDNQYLLYADDDTVQQRELVGAAGQLLGRAKTDCRSPVDALLQPRPSPLLQLDLPFATTQLPAGIWRRCPRGLMHHLPQVLTEYLAARHLTPLRILIRGPPAGGKSYLASRLSALYGLMHINTAKILAELPLLDQETQKAASAQLASKEGRISPQIFAKMAQHLLARHPEAANQGWIMEGWPKSLQAARLLCGGGACDGGSKGLGSPDRLNRRTTGGVNKDKKPSGTGSSSGAATAPQSSGAKNRRTTMPDDPVDSAVTMQNPDLVPQYLIELEVPEDELIRRVRAVAAAEAAATAAAAASTAAASAGKTSARGAGSKPVSAKGGATSAAGGAPTGDKGAGVAGAVGSHNNEKDWARRMEAYKQLIQEDSADLAANRAAILDAVRAATATPDSSSSAAGSPGRHKPGTSGGGKGGAAASMDPADLPPDVRLPEHGGFVAYFVESGCKYLHVKNTYDEAAAATAAALIGPRVQPEQHQQQSDQLQPQHHVALPPLHIERQLKEWIGPPHNYEGFPDQSEHRDSSAATGSAVGVAVAAADSVVPADQQHGYSRSLTVPGLNLSGPGGHNGQLVPQEWAEILEVARALTAEQAARVHSKLQCAAQPLMSTLLSGVMPALMTGLVKTALHRPDDPWQVIADELLKAAEQIEASYKDPYDDPIYAVQLAKVEAKAAREAARAEAAAAKVAREEAARATANAQAEAEAAAAAAAATHSSYGTGGPASAGRADQDGAAGSRPTSAIGGGKAGAAKSAAAKAAAAGGRPASSMKPR